MEKKYIVIVCSFFALLPTRGVYPKTTLFSPVSHNFIGERVTTNPHTLLLAAKYALNHYFESENKQQKKLLSSAVLERGIVSKEQTKKTLEFIVETIENDEKKYKNRYRILNPEFLKKHFSLIKWNGDQKEAKKNNHYIPKNKIRLTGYAVFRCKGSVHKTKEHPYALYQVTSKRFDTVFRTKYSKQNILRGILEKKWFKGHVKPLIWLSRHDLEQSLLQGSVLVQINKTVAQPPVQEKLFNVEVNNVSEKNNFAYNKKIKKPWDQKQYWFFREIKKWIKSTCRSTPPKKERLQDFIRLGGAAFAGDVENLGLGKIIALRYKNCLTGQNEIKLGVLADRGSAFINNLYQLDLFAGIFDNRNQFNRFFRRFPDTVDAYILKKT